MGVWNWKREESRIGFCRYCIFLKIAICNPVFVDCSNYMRCDIAIIWLYLKMRISVLGCLLVLLLRIKLLNQNAAIELNLANIGFDGGQKKSINNIDSEG